MSYQSTIQFVGDTFTFKYVTITGIVVMVYDHLITISNERQCFWKAPHSIEKYSFLLNRYLVAVVLLVNLHGIATSFPYTNRGCQLLIIISSLFGTISAILANVLILRRVLDLWKDDKKTRIFLCSLYVASSSVSLSMTLLSDWRAWPDIIWFPGVKMCLIKTVPSSYPAMWGAPLFFEFSIAALVVYNALATPRSAAVPIRRALQNNGIFFFLSVIVLRLLNTVYSAFARKTLAVIGSFFIWAGITTFLNRSILRLREAEIKDQKMSRHCLELVPVIVIVSPEPSEPVSEIPRCTNMVDGNLDNRNKAANSFFKSFRFFTSLSSGNTDATHSYSPRTAK